MKVRHDEGIANHVVLKPCVNIRESIHEASVEVCTGQPLSRDRHNKVQSADDVGVSEGNTPMREMRAYQRLCVVEELGMYRSSMFGNREIS